jgi:hypothetical protein
MENGVKQEQEGKKEGAGRRGLGAGR